MDKMINNKTSNKMSNKEAAVLLGIFLVVICILFTIVLVADRRVDSGCYIGDTLSYDGIDITVQGVSTKKNENPESDYYGLTELKVYFTYKNNKTKDFDVSTSDIHIETEDKKEKYDCTTFSATQSIMDAILGETLIPGAEKAYNISFYVPYSIDQKKFSICFDWGFGCKEQVYHLYSRDGSNIIVSENGVGNNGESNKTEDYSKQFAGATPIGINITYNTSNQILSIKQTNNSGRTIVAIKYLIVIYDAYGDVMQKYGYGVSALTATYDKQSIKSGSSAIGEWEMTGFSGGKSVDVYVYSVCYSDGIEWGNHNLTVTEVKKYAPKVHIVGK